MVLTCVKSMGVESCFFLSYVCDICIIVILKNNLSLESSTKKIAYATQSLVSKLPVKLKKAAFDLVAECPLR